MDKHSAPLERKDDSGASVADMKKAITDVSTAFEEFKSTNDAAQKEFMTKGAVDPLIEEKMAKLNGHLDKFEHFSTDLKAAQDKLKAQDDLQERFDRLETAMKRSGTGTTEEKANRVPEWAHAVVKANINGINNLSAEQQKTLADVAMEYKALNVSTDTAGGYLAPVEFVREIIKGITEVSPARQLARIRNTANKAINIPKRTGQFAARRISEGATKSETTGLSYGMEELVAPEVYAMIDITNDMLEDSAFDFQGEIETEATEQFAVREGLEFVSGTGVGEMEGILVNSGVGFTVSGDATTITSDGLITLKHDIKSGYARNANFILNRTSIGAIRRLKDLNGQYIWQIGLAAGVPNTIDGDPYVEFPDMPSEGAGAFPVAYGDFRRGYTMLDRIAMEMLRDPYTQATSGAVRFIFRKRSGGKVVLPEAIRKLKCSA